MKITTTITKEERARTYNAVLNDPCKDIDCAEIDCETCPLHSAAIKMRKAQERFIDILDSMVVIEE